MRQRRMGKFRSLPSWGGGAGEGLMWAGAAAAIGAIGGRTARRAALRGVGSLAIATAITRTITRPSSGRHGASAVPFGRSASAAAFAVGAALEAPRYGLGAAPVGAAIAASRLRAGASGLGDVLAGLAIGGFAAALTCHWWPLKPEKPAGAVPPRLPAPALPAGAGLFVVVNPGSGVALGTGDSAAPTERLRSLLPEAEITELEPGDDLGALLDKAASRAAGCGGALGVCGGDGTLNAAAGAAVRHGVPLAAFPGGTFNHFAADLGVESLEEVANAVGEGAAVSVDLARASSPDGAEEQVFLNTFSIGVYPELVRAREKLEDRIGKWPALAIGLTRVLARTGPIDVAVNGEPRRLWLLFAGNGVYHPAGFAPTYRPHLDDGLLDIRAVDGSTPFARTRLLVAMLTGTLHSSRVLVATQMRRLRLDGLSAAPHFAYDGEVSQGPVDSLVLGKSVRALTVYRPVTEHDEVLGLPAAGRPQA
ncbi:diacylglycerol/lipid kinase family protein [Streptomyces sp. NPDC048639]|uniref:diacylglycerol/lipid kinase family protein n=1 Tax=Streptomyces sp. NPDC048639 TaxID=3365581 RepID=UPI00371C9C9E